MEACIGYSHIMLAASTTSPLTAAVLGERRPLKRQAAPEGIRQDATAKMNDCFTPEQRSRVMASVKQRNTAPEMIIRKALWGLGYRYRLHVKNLPSRPDIVFPSRRRVIFVHGCFWHRHPGCRRTTTPVSRRDFWEAKFAANVARDAASVIALENAGWQVLVVWECEVKVKDRTALVERLTKFLGPPGATDPKRYAE